MFNKIINFSVEDRVPQIKGTCVITSLSPSTTTPFRELGAGLLNE